VLLVGIELHIIALLATTTTATATVAAAILDVAALTTATALTAATPLTIATTATATATTATAAATTATATVAAAILDVAAVTALAGCRTDQSDCCPRLLHGIDVPLPVPLHSGLLRVVDRGNRHHERIGRRRDGAACGLGHRGEGGSACCRQGLGKRADQCGPCTLHGADSVVQVHLLHALEAPRRKLHPHGREHQLIRVSWVAR